MDTPPAASSPTRVNWMWRLLRALVAGIFRGLLRWKARVEGIHHVPAEGPAVVTWNHHSYVDYLFVALAIVEGRRRPVRMLGKSEIWDNPVTRWIATKAGAVPVYRGRRGGGGAYDAAIAALRSGDLVALAPEQTISRSFELLPFASGAVRMAREAGVPIVPGVSWGSHRALTKGRPPRLRFGLPVWTAFGEPLWVQPDEDLQAASQRLRAATEVLLHRIQAAYPERPAPGDDWWLPRRLGGSAPPHDEVLAEHRARRLDRAANRDG